MLEYQRGASNMSAVKAWPSQGAEDKHGIII